MKEEKKDIIKFDILQLKSLNEISDVIKESEAQKKIKEERELFNHFIETGKVKTLSSKSEFAPQVICKTTKIRMGMHLQTVRKLSIPKNPKRKFTI